jgi:hypothetical protein
MANEPDDMTADGAEDTLWEEALTAEDGEAPENEADGSDDDTHHGGSDDIEDDDQGTDEAGDLPPEVPLDANVLQAENVKLRADQNAAHGRIAALRKQVAAVTTAAEGADPTAALEALSEDYPEIAAPILAALKRTNGQVSAMAEAKRAELVDAEASLASTHASNSADLEKMEPGGLAYVKANEAAFSTWIMDQPLEQRDAARRNGDQIENPTEAADLIRRFKLFEAVDADDPPPVINTRRQRQMAATAGPRRGGRPVSAGMPKDGDPDDMFDMALEAEAKN